MRKEEGEKWIFVPYSGVLSNKIINGLIINDSFTNKSNVFQFPRRGFFGVISDLLSVDQMAVFMEQERKAELFSTNTEFRAGQLKVRQGDVKTRERAEETEISGDDTSREAVKTCDEERVLGNMKLVGEIL